MAANDDLRFVYEQARRFVSARPWEHLAHASLYLDLKLGSWQEACAQHFSNGPMNVLFLFAGHRNLLDVQRAGMAEPPAGTIFVELLDDRASPATIAAAREAGWPAELRPIPAFRVITPNGWLPLERSQNRLLALAFAAITDFDGARDLEPNAEVAGELTMPEATRGRYRARRAPANDDGKVPLFGMPRLDLYGDADCTLSFTTISWSEYWALKQDAPFCRAAKLPFEERGELIPLVTISGSRAEAAEIAQKLMAADPVGITFGESDDVLAAILVGLKESYMLLQVEEQREELMLWRHATRSSGGAHAVVVEDKDAGEQPADQEVSIRAVFECRSGAN
jgi:hypothetical protein